MKNTAKKILALVFAVAMICTLAVPAFAADEALEDVEVSVISPTAVKGADGKVVYYEYAANARIKANLDTDAALENFEDYKYPDLEVGDTLHDLLKDMNGKDYIDYSSSKKVIEAVSTAPDLEEAGAKGAWVVAVNGSIVTDYDTYELKEKDVVVIYWYDEILQTRLLLADYSNLLAGVVSYYYIDVEGNKQPAVDLNVKLFEEIEAEDKALENKLNDLVPGADLSDINSSFTSEWWDNYYTTDEDGQIWIAPEYLARLDENNTRLYIMSAKTSMNGEARDRNYPVAIYNVKASADEYDEDMAEYYEMFGRCGSITTMVITERVRLADVAGTAYEGPNTGDMTMVYVLVAAAAIVTLGAVVVMKKKAVKAN